LSTDFFLGFDQAAKMAKAKRHEDKDMRKELPLVKKQLALQSAALAASQEQVASLVVDNT
jgi:hypothetical protein